MARMHPKWLRGICHEAPRGCRFDRSMPTFKSGAPLGTRGRRRVPHVFDAAREQYASTQD
jgi:hypothetical protein